MSISELDTSSFEHNAWTARYDGIDVGIDVEPHNDFEWAVRLGPEYDDSLCRWVALDSQDLPMLEEDESGVFIVSGQLDLDAGIEAEGFSDVMIYGYDAENCSDRAKKVGLVLVEAVLELPDIRNNGAKIMAHRNGQAEFMHAARRWPSDKANKITASAALHQVIEGVDLIKVSPKKRISRAALASGSASFSLMLLDGELQQAANHRDFRVHTEA